MIIVAFLWKKREATDSTEVVWRGSASNTLTAGTGFFALMGLGSTDLTFNFEYAEIRISNSSLFESISAAPEPSTIATGARARDFRARALRRRRNS